MFFGSETIRDDLRLHQVICAGKTEHRFNPPTREPSSINMMCMQELKQSYINKCPLSSATAADAAMECSMPGHWTSISHTSMPDFTSNAFISEQETTTNRLLLLCSTKSKSDK